jgi:hypothetical protein
MGTTNWTERVALCASAACLVHCLVLPLLLAALPALSTVLAIPESFHAWALAAAVPSAAYALVQGRARHGRSAPLTAGATGLSLLAAGAFAFGETRWEVPVTVCGSLTLAAAHLANWRLRHGCACEGCTSDSGRR